jgi:hypothetical protein
MHIWSLVAIIFLLLLGAIFIGISIVNISKTSGLIQTKQLIPFTQKLTQTNGSPTPNLQLSCPVGKKINIVGAYYQVIDPFNECTSKPLTAIQAACNPSQEFGKCSSSGDCLDQAYECDTTKGMCVLKTNLTDCSSTTIPYPPYTQSPTYQFIPVNGNQGYCQDVLVCYSGTQGSSGSFNGQNSSCQSCAVRDASAYIADQCDGQATCSLDMSNFGPSPCGIPPSTTAVSGPEDVLTERQAGDPYYQLPFTYGSNGLPAIPNSDLGGQSPSIGPTSVNIGYYVHGIYTCV